MPRRKPRKPRLLPQPKAKAIATMDIVTVDNPGYQPGNPDSIRKIDVVRTYRDNPLRRMHARGQIDDDEYEAGRRCEAAYEAAGFRIAAQDPTREYVDGGSHIPELITDHRVRAVKLIGRIRAAIGKTGEDLVREVIAECRFPAQIARESWQNDKLGELFVARLFRSHLAALTVEFGLRTAPVDQRRAAR